MIQKLDIKERDNLTQLFLPEKFVERAKMSDEQHQEIIETLLGWEKLYKRLGIKWEKTPEEDPVNYLRYKKDDFFGKNNRYRCIFDLCRILCITNIYDIGCEALNQSFQLIKHTNMSYTGIDSYFSLNDWREEDINNNNCYHPFVYEAPPPFCDGRIKFVKGRYPDMDLAVKSNNIAVASCSLTMCKGYESISKTATALTRDFERILFNPPNPKFRLEDYKHWKAADWKEFSICLVASGRFIFATKNSEDIRRMRKMYPLDSKSAFDTGIDIGNSVSEIPSEYCKDWIRECE